MSTATPDLITSSPSPLRVGLVGWRFTVVLYLLIVSFQFLVNFVVNGIVYLSVPDVTEQAEQAATNSAFVTGVFLFVCGVVSATVNMRASALSGGSRPVLTAASYVHSIVIIGLGSLIWWLLIAIHPALFVMGRDSFPLGIDSWIYVVLTWVACDGAGRFIGGLSRCIGSTWKRAFVLMVAIPLGICAIGAPITWLVLTLVHKSGYLPPMHPAFYLLGLISLIVVVSGWPLTASGHIRRIG
ncbi:hypothetical protein [Kytococcus sedentarius]|uniref:hypothetical protein n=1 Tax=Kytococcus sedentarius TaxID=1276 RepID=UPI000660EE76|nr:hypothetical protein [Kytococcus sedentarius]